MKKNHPSDGSPQREAEEFVRKKRHLNHAKGVDFFGAKVDLDGANKNGFFEIYAHTGKLKTGGYRKVVNDAVKLFLAARCNKKKNKTIIFVDEVVQKEFKGNSWRAVTLRKLGVKTVVQNIPRELKEKLRRAQRRQARGIAKRNH